MKQKEVALPLPRANVMQRQRLAGFRQSRQFMVMRGEKTAAAVRLVDSLGHGPGQREAVVRGSAAPHLVKYHEAAFSGLRKNRGGLHHFDHEGRTPARKIVRSADAAEQTVDHPDTRRLGRHEAAGLRQQHDQRALPKKSRFAAHIGAADQPEPVMRAEPAIISDKGLTLICKRCLDHGVTATLDIEREALHHLRTRPSAFRRPFRLPGRNVDARKRSGGASDLVPSRHRFTH